MTVIVPEHSAVKRRSGVVAGVVAGVRPGVRKVEVDDDPTHYPDWEPMSDNLPQSNICGPLVPVLEHYQASRGIVCFVGRDNFIYWVRGNIKKCVSPDVYILPGVLPKALPMDYGGKENGSWKIWELGVAPNFALEVKAFDNARKDELQSPERHDELGVEELIVFDPYAHRRRDKEKRKRFCVYRRNENNQLVIVLNTNDDRVKSEELDAFFVAVGDRDNVQLRLGFGPNGDELCPFETERADMEAQRANEATRRADEQARLRQAEAQRADEQARLRQAEAQRADEQARLRQEEARMRQEEAQRADEQARLRQEEAQRADEQARMRQEEAQRADEQARLREAEAQRADEATRRADEAQRRAAELEAEIARLRAGVSTKRRKKQT